MDSKYKLKQWKKELNRLTDETGITQEDICKYLGVSYNRDIGFYVKLPRKRAMYIGIGMAYGLSLSAINRWITYYGMKRRLYSKDIAEDMVWIYLINRNYAEWQAGDADNVADIGADKVRRTDKAGSTNYFRMYERCQEIAFETYLNIWEDIIANSVGTSDLDKRLAMIGDGDPCGEIKDFVVANIDSFKTAYARPRKFLRRYLSSILITNGSASDNSDKDSLSSLRGWLDDSMINYLAGSEETINVIDMNTGRRTPDIRHIPKSRKSHISLALSLGMTCQEINDYLELMGFAPLDEESEEEKFLIRTIDKWDSNHPLQRAYKEKYIYEDNSIEMDAEDESQAVSDMLMLRQELRDEYRRSRKAFPYLK